MKFLTHLTPVGLLCLTATSFGQSFNIDCGSNTGHPAPSTTYGAAAAQAGTWNTIPAFSAAVALDDLAGATSAVTVTESGAFGNFDFDNAGTTGDDDALLDDNLDIGGAGSSTTLTISGLEDGDYSIYTYAWAPDDPTGGCTTVDVVGSASGAQTVCGAWVGAHVLGDTYALHTVTIAGGADLVVTGTTSNGFGSLNGVQIVFVPTGPFDYCAPANANSLSANGAVLTHVSGYGTANALFNLTDVPDQPGLLFTGNNQIDSPFGCGRRCVGGTTIRGAVFTPSGNQALNVPLDMSNPVSVNVQYWYRDPANLANCGSAFNLSNALMP